MRRRAALTEFALADPAATHLLQGTVDTFIAARLLTTNEIAGTTTIEVSHEALNSRVEATGGVDRRGTRRSVPLTSNPGGCCRVAALSAINRSTLSRHATGRSPGLARSLSAQP